MVGIGRRATADKAGPRRDKSQVIAVAFAHRLADDGHGLCGRLAVWLVDFSISLALGRLGGRLAKMSQSGSESAF